VNHAKHRRTASRTDKQGRWARLPTSGASHQAESDHQGVLLLCQFGRANCVALCQQGIRSDQTNPNWSKAELAHQGCEATMRGGLMRASNPHRAGEASSPAGQTSIDPALEHFDSLPDSARTALPVVCGLFGICPATAWRRVKSGSLPQPVREGRTTRWVVGDLRRALAK
jgi:predicted DNA-binding transcriptional regulator AlpA